MSESKLPNQGILPTSQILPNSLNNLVQEYSSSSTYVQNLSNSNPVTRDQTIVNELSNIPLDPIIQFKLATQLANNSVQTGAYQKYIKWRSAQIHRTIVSRPDPKTLTGIFFMLLNLYSYEALNDLAEDFIVIQEGFVLLDDTVHSIADYLYYLVDTQENIVKTVFIENTDYVLSLLDPKLPEIPEDIIGIFNAAYTEMIQNEPNIYTTLPVNNYIEIFHKYVLNQY